MDDAIAWALQYFKSMDEANAAIHCAPVRYSPITFRLAELLDAEIDSAAEEVLRHRGKYEEDRGRQ